MRSVITLSILLLAGFPVLAQRGGGDRGDRPGGGPGGGGRGGMDADSSFNRLLSSYGGTGDTVDYSRIPPEYRQQRDSMLARFGAPPTPTSGTVTRAQFAEEYNKRMEAMRASGGFGRPGGGPPGGPSAATPIAPPAAPGVTVTAVPGGTAPTPAAPGAEKTVSDEEAARMMRRMDANEDGRITPEEARRSDRLSANFAHYDANKDGVIDASEYKIYLTDRENNRGPAGERGGGNGGGNGGGWNGGGGGGWNGGGDNRNAPQPPAEEERAVAVRYGKLPTGLPSWWNELDSDKDGQIGLYEWRAAKKPMEEYLALDLNKDGLLTAEEYLRAKKLPLSATTSEVKTDSANAGFRGRGNGADRSNGYSGGGNNGGDRRTKEEKKEDKKESKESKGNPFRN